MSNSKARFTAMLRVARAWMPPVAIVAGVLVQYGWGWALIAGGTFSFAIAELVKLTQRVAAELKQGNHP